jgi:hypothetical protein
MIVAADPPGGSTSIVADELAWAIGTGGLARLIGQPVRPEQLSVTLPHPVFALSLADLRQEAPPTPTGWRYLVELDHQVVALAATDVFDGRHRFAGFGVGPPVAATVAAAELADNLLGGSPERFTLAVVEVYELHVTLMRVTTANDTAAGFIPVGRTGSLEERLYPPAEIRTALLEMAAALPDNPRPTAGNPLGG